MMVESTHDFAQQVRDTGGGRDVFIEGVGFWSAGLSDWAAARAALRAATRDVASAVPPERLDGVDPAPDIPAGQPLPAVAPGPVATRLAAAERRRAPATVALAMTAADQAATMSGRDPATLACVFASANGDLGLTDYIGETVAHDARLLSPTRFHNSVHNAPAGYWTMAVGCHESSTALAAYDRSFAVGLLEALSQCVADGIPVLFSAYEMAASGLLAQVTRSRQRFAVALVLAPQRGAASRWRMRWRIVPSAECQVSDPAAFDPDGLAANSCAGCLPLCGALAEPGPEPVIIQVGAAISLQLELRLIE